MLELAIVGLGGWGRRLVESVQGTSDKVRFTRAVVTDTEKSKAFAAKHDITLGTDIAEAARDPRVVGVVSSGPAHLHAAHSMIAIEAGKPVLAVKPLALNLDEARALEAAATKAGVALCMGYNRCFFPNVMELRRRLKAGAFGQLLHTEGDFCVHRYGSVKRGSWKADPTNAPAGALADHMLYLTIETLGRIEAAHAIGLNQASDNDLADTTAVLLKCANNATALLTACGMTPDYYRFTVFGTEGWAEVRDADTFIFQPRKGPREEMRLDQVDAERNEVEAFADAIAGTHPFPCPADQAVHSAAVIEAMARSNALGRMVEVP
jgi:predicted dehydrogenase